VPVAFFSADVLSLMMGIDSFGGHLKQLGADFACFRRESGILHAANLGITY
jgi:hypothetical protein